MGVWVGIVAAFLGHSPGILCQAGPKAIDAGAAGGMVCARVFGHSLGILCQAGPKALAAGAAGGMLSCVRTCTRVSSAVPGNAEGVSRRRCRSNVIVRAGSYQGRGGCVLLVVRYRSRPSTVELHRSPCIVVTYLRYAL